MDAKEALEKIFRQLERINRIMSLDGAEGGANESVGEENVDVPLQLLHSGVQAIKIGQI